MTSYADFLASKTAPPPSFGREPGELNPHLFDFQRAIVTWAVRRGRAAIFADCGMGKALQLLEWCRQSGDRALVLAPLAVAEQLVREGEKFGIPCRQVADPDDQPGIQITNYEKLHRFVDAAPTFDAIALDESSILKSLDGKTRTLLIDKFTCIPRRLCCTATPAPNDLAELANHSEFLGIMPRVEMLASFFVHDSERSGADGWRLKGHAEGAFWKWVAKWAVYVRRPSDLGFSDDGFVLPPLTIRDEVVASNWKPSGVLFAGASMGGIADRRAARRATIGSRVERAAEIIRASSEQWLVWCGLNDEGDALEESLGDECVQIAGKDSDADKLERERLWRTGQKRVLITKLQVFGWGMNWFHANKMLFLGLGDSFEAYYQGIRREWRFGQKRPVEVVIVTTDAEQAVADNVRRKEADAARLAEGVVAHVRDSMFAEVRGNEAARDEYKPTVAMQLPSWLTGVAQ